MMPFVCVFWGQRQASSTPAVALSQGDDALRAELSPRAVQDKGDPLPRPLTDQVEIYGKCYVKQVLN